MKWFDLRSWAIGLAVGGLLVSLLGRLEKESLPQHPGFKLGKYERDGNRTAAGSLASLLFRADGAVEIEVWGKFQLSSPPTVIVGKWSVSGGFVKTEGLQLANRQRAGVTTFSKERWLEENAKADAEWRGEPAPKLSYSSALEPRHFKMDVMSSDLPHGATQLIGVKVGDQDLLRRDFVRWKWVGD